MTIGTAGNRVTFNCDGTTTVFPIPLQSYFASDFTVMLTSAAGAETMLLLNSDYSLATSGTLAPTAWTLTTLAAAAFPSGSKLQAFVDPVQEQQTSYASGQAFPSQAVQANVDRLTQMVQRLQDQVDRTIIAPDGDVAPVMGLPSALQRANTYQTYDVNGNTSVAVGLVAGTVLSAAIIGTFISPPTQAELATGVGIVAPQLPYGNLGRIGLIPNNNSPTVTAANLAALQAYCNPLIGNGPTGEFFFPNIGGATTTADIFYFAPGAVQVRDGMRIRLNQCQVNVNGAFTAAFNVSGFFTAIRDVEISDGEIVINYNGTGGAGNGSAFRIGSRSGWGFGAFPTGIFDQDNLVANGLPLQGGVTLRNLRITSNNPNPQAHIIFLTGGLRNIVFENLWIDGQNAMPGNGVYYEYGWSSTNGAPLTNSSWSSSHMTASSFRSITVSNLAIGGTSQGFGFNGAYGCTVDDINVLTADQGIGFGTGEAMFYRTWALDGTTRRELILSNLRIGGCALGLVMGGYNPVGSGYLAAVINALPTAQKFQAQTDLLSYTLDGFSIGTPSGTAIIATGAQVSILNGACNGGGIEIGDECIHSTIMNVDVIGAAGPNGIRYGTPAAIWSPPRPKFTTVENCKVIGSNGAAIALTNCQSARIVNNQLGANTLYDIANETTQTNGVNLDATCFGVKCVGNFITTAGGAVGYQSANNTIGNMNSIESERNLAGLIAGGGVTGGGGLWDTDFLSPSAQVIASSGTISVASLKFIRLAPAGAVTGVIVQAGQKDGQIAYLINESTSADSITFAASGTSRVAGGTGVVLAGLAKLILVWDSAANLWF